MHESDSSNYRGGRVYSCANESRNALSDGNDMVSMGGALFGERAMKKSLTAAERVYIGRVKELPCSCCNAPAPSIAHHVRTGQGMSQRAQHWLTVALCESCHTGSLGIHGDKTMMKIMNMDEMDLLAKTIERLNK